MRTLKDIESDEDELYDELQGITNAMNQLRDREYKIRKKLNHLEIERTHLQQQK